MAVANDRRADFKAPPSPVAPETHTERRAPAMSAVLLPSPEPEAAGALSGALLDGGAQVPPDRVLQSIGAFYASDAAAQQVAHQLHLELGLSARCCMQLGPADATPWRFGPLTRQWRGPRGAIEPGWYTDFGIVTALCALLVGLAATVWLVLDLDLGPTDDREMMTRMLLLLVMLCGVTIAAMAFTLPRRRRVAVRFDRMVHQQLTAGRWALVVHGVPWQRQAEVLALLRSSSQSWCAAWPPTRRL
jgi:hypothetical protein